jgi:uncharacterized membrane protein YebE (DUF533 family)
MGAPGAVAAAVAAAAPAAPFAGPPSGGAAPTSAPGAVPIPPPPVFDPTTGQAIASPPPAAAPAAVAPAPAATAPVAPEAASEAAPSDEAQAAAMLLVRAMVAAANADGVIDETERAEILGRLASTGLGPDERAALAAELDRPRPVAALVAEVPNPEIARQFYAVSLLAIDVDNAAEKIHLRSLPAMLGLAPDAVAAIHSELGVPAV